MHLGLVYMWMALEEAFFDFDNCTSLGPSSPVASQAKKVLDLRANPRPAMLVSAVPQPSIFVSFAYHVTLISLGLRLLRR